MECSAHAPSINQQFTPTRLLGVGVQGRGLVGLPLLSAQTADSQSHHWGCKARPRCDLALPRLSKAPSAPFAKHLIVPAEVRSVLIFRISDLSGCRTSDTANP